MSQVKTPRIIDIYWDETVQTLDMLPAETQIETAYHALEISKVKRIEKQANLILDHIYYNLDQIRSNTTNLIEQDELKKFIHKLKKLHENGKSKVLPAISEWFVAAINCLEAFTTKNNKDIQDKVLVCIFSAGLSYVLDGQGDLQSFFTVWNEVVRKKVSESPEKTKTTSGNNTGRLVYHGVLDVQDNITSRLDRRDFVHDALELDDSCNDQ